MKSFRYIGLLGLGVIACAIAVPPALAVDNLIVTARKRTEDAQSVPMAITAFSGESLERAGIEDLREITNLVAGLQFDGLPGKFLTTPTIRGLSQVSRIDDENNVSIFIDGVYVSGRDSLDFSLLDLERVEIVKGPQSALYGRNSYAGAINFITKKPGDEFEARLSATVGNFDKKRAQISMSGPIIPETLSARLSAAYDDFGGGYENSINGSDVGGYESMFVSGALRFTPADMLDIVLSTYYADDEIDNPAQSVIPGNCDPATSPFHPVAFSPFRRFCGEVPSIDKDDPAFFTYDPRVFGPRRKISRNSLNVNWDLGDLSVTSITGYNRFTAESVTDQDRQQPGSTFPTTLVSPTSVTLPIFAGFGSQKHEELSQELRIQSADEGRLQWMFGGSYYYLNREQRPQLVIDSSALPSGVSTTDVLARFPFVDLSGGFPRDLFNSLPALNELRSNTTTYAVYGSASFDISDRLTGRAEVRYTEETKRQRDPLVSRDQEETFDFVTPRFTLDFQATEDALLYGSIAKGAKAGGFNTPNPFLPPEFEAYEPEFNWTYEVGAKTDWFDGQMRVNVAAFYVDMDDIQITNQVPGSIAFATLNAGTGSSKGIELEIAATPIEGLDLNFGYALADSKFDDAADGSLRALAPPIGTLLPSTDVSGQQLPRTSKHTINGSVQYTHTLSQSYDGFIRFDGRYESAQKGFTSDVLEAVGERFNGNLRAGVTANNWELTAWAENIFDDDTPLLAASTLLLGDFSRLPTASLPTPRIFGLTLTLHN